MQFAPEALSEAPPSEADVVVIGGGIVGVSAALALAVKGASVALCEKGVIGGEQSGRALGWVRVMGRDPRDIPLNLESRRLWQSMRQAAGETGYRRSGIIYVCERTDDLGAHENWLASARMFDVGSRIVGAAEAAQLAPHSTKPVVGGLYTPDDGHAEPKLAASAIAEAARRRGARILTRCAARSLDVQAGRVAGVFTERGRIACQAVLLAGGVWSSRFCGNLRIDLPLLPLTSFMMRTGPVEGPDTCVRQGAFGIRKNLDGGYTVGSAQALADVTPDAFRRFFQYLPALRKQWGTINLRFGRSFIENLMVARHWTPETETPFERIRVLEPGSSPWSESVWRGVTSLYPSLGQTMVVEKWGGVIDVTPDSLPVISQVGPPGLFVAAGFSGGGFGAGPGAGQLAADLVMGDHPAIDPLPYRYERFFDGSKLVVAA